MQRYTVGLGGTGQGGSWNPLLVVHLSWAQLVAYGGAVTVLALGYRFHVELARATLQWCKFADGQEELKKYGPMAVEALTCMRLFGVSLYTVQINPSLHGEKYRRRAC